MVAQFRENVTVMINRYFASSDNSVCLLLQHRNVLLKQQSISVPISPIDSA